METFTDIIKKEPLVLVDFFAVWCGPCKSMHPILEELKKQMGNGIRIIKIDVDRNQPLAAQMEVMSVPTLVLYRNGVQVWRQSGAVPLDALKSVISQY